MDSQAQRGLYPDYPIRTQRLHLRPHRLEDVDDLVAFHSDPEVVRYIPWPVRDRAQTQAAVNLRMSQSKITNPGQWLVLAIELRETGSVIGEVLLKWVSESDRRGELGFVLGAQYQGLGLATEAARAILRLGFEEFRLRRIVAVCIAENFASARMLRRLGIQQEGHLRDNAFFKGRWVDQLIFGMLEREWRGQERS